jgi:hypothetical protein
MYKKKLLRKSKVERKIGAGGTAKRFAIQAAKWKNMTAGQAHGMDQR